MKAVELMTKAGVWTSGSPIEPSAFGLSSLSVRAIVTAMTGQLGIQACDSKNPAELLRSCAVKITAILAKSASVGGGGSGASGFTPVISPSVLTDATTAAATAAATAATAATGSAGGSFSVSTGLTPVMALSDAAAAASVSGAVGGGSVVGGVSNMATVTPPTLATAISFGAGGGGGVVRGGSINGVVSNLATVTPPTLSPAISFGAGGGGGVVRGGSISGVVSNLATVNPSTLSPAISFRVGGDGSMSPSAVLDVSGAKAERQVQCEGAMFQWLFTHTHGIHPDTSHTYAQAFYAAKMTTIDRVAKKVGKKPGLLLSLGVDEDDADDIVQAMRDAGLLTAP